MNESLIWDYIDGRLDSDARIQFEKEIERNTELKKLYEQCMSVHESLQSMELQQPPAGFAADVVDQLPDLYSPDNGRYRLGFPKLPLFVFTMMASAAIVLLLFSSDLGNHSWNWPSIPEAGILVSDSVLFFGLGILSLAAVIHLDGRFKRGGMAEMRIL